MKQAESPSFVTFFSQLKSSANIEKLCQVPSLIANNLWKLFSLATWFFFAKINLFCTTLIVKVGLPFWVIILNFKNRLQENSGLKKSDTVNLFSWKKCNKLITFKQTYDVACLMLWSEESARDEMKTQLWSFQSRKESILKCLLIEEQHFIN